MLFQFTIKSVLSDLEEKIPIDTENKYDYLRKSQFTQITIFDGSIEGHQHSVTVFYLQYLAADTHVTESMLGEEF